MSAGTVIGALTIAIGADAAGLTGGVTTALRSLSSLDGGVSQVLKRLAQFSTAAVGAGVALITGLTARSLDTLDAQSKLSRQLGATVEGLQTLVRAGDLAGASQEVIAGAATRLNQRLGEAMRTGIGPAADALKRLGLNARDLSRLDIDERFAVIADRVKAIGMNAAQTAATLRDLGIRQKEIISLIEEGGDSIRGSREDVRLFGVAVSGVDARKIEIANDSLTVFSLTLRGLGNQLAVAVAPVLNAIAEKWRQIVTDAGGMGGIVARSIETTFDALDTFLAYLDRLKKDSKPTTDSLSMIGEAGASAFRVASIPFRAFGELLGWIEGKGEETAETLAKPPATAAWRQWFRERTEELRLLAEQAQKEYEERRNRKPPDLDPLSGEQRKALEEKLLNLKKAISTEDEMLRVQRELHLREIQEFEQKRVVTAEQGAALRLQVEDKHAKAMRELIQSRLTDSVATEIELQQQKFNKLLEDLRIFETNKTLTVEQAEALRKKIVEKNELDILRLRADLWARAAQVIDVAMGQISAVIGREGEKQFGLFKAISLATAAVSQARAIIGAYTVGMELGGPPLAWTFAGIAAAGTAAMLAKMAGLGPNSKPDGGAAAAAGGGGSAPTAAAPARAAEAMEPRQAINITLHGTRFHRDEIVALINQINDVQRMGAKLNFHRY